MEEEAKRALEGAINSGYENLICAIIRMAARDARPSPHTGHYTNAAYAIADCGGFTEPRDEVQAFFCSKGFLWLLWLIGCEPGGLRDIAGRIAMQAFGP